MSSIVNLCPQVPAPLGLCARIHMPMPVGLRRINAAAVSREQRGSDVGVTRIELAAFGYLHIESRQSFGLVPWR